jgi:hypothetical protein
MGIEESENVVFRAFLLRRLGVMIFQGLGKAFAVCV